jgi:uncharacterized protein
VENNIYVLKQNSGEIICQKMIVAKKMFVRMKGLMFSTQMPDCDGLLISPCNSIHTFFMLYNLDLMFLDQDFKVVKIIYNLPPWRVTWLYFSARHVVEMSAGTLKKGIKVGDKLEAICIN